MPATFTRFFDMTFKNGTTTQAMIVSNGNPEAKPIPVVQYKGCTWRYRKQLLDKTTGMLLPEFMYVQDNGVEIVKDPAPFFQTA